MGYIWVIAGIFDDTGPRGWWYKVGMNRLEDRFLPLRQPHHD